VDAAIGKRRRSGTKDGGAGVKYRVVVPGLGATGGGVRLIAWLAAPGQFVKSGAPLFVVETDKASVEVEAFRSGYLAEILASPGEEVALGTLVAILVDSLEEVEGESDAAMTTGCEILGREPIKSADNPAVLLRALELDANKEVDERSIYGKMVLIRYFEDHLYHLFLQGLVPGTLHQYQGQEAVAVGVCSALRDDDVIFSTHRPVGHFLAKGVSARSIAAELWGKVTGCSGGKGGQMHLADASKGAFPSNAIVGANIPIATGAALGFKLSGSDRIAVSFFGDGATNIGAFHEGINLAAVKKAPVVFVCENNQYAASTHISHNMLIRNISERAAAYGIPGKTVDGMDVLAVHQNAREAVRQARAGHGPTLLEFLTYRYAGHSRGDPGGYRDKAELTAWRSRDPIAKLRQQLVNQGKATAEQLEQIESECRLAVEDAVIFAMESPEPSIEALTQNVFST
jgi:TPP-dependent pyruvate/acetoin dehydrogenase alpha subunit